MSDSKHRNAHPEQPHGGAPQSAQHGKAAMPSPAQDSLDKRTQQKDSPSDDKSGRVAFDDKGNPIWEWQTSTGVFEQDVSTQRLKKLEAPELSLASTQPVPTLGNKSGAQPKTKSKEDTGFNPYNSDGPIKPRTDRSAASHPALVHKRPPSKQQPEPPKSGAWDKFKSRFS